MFTLIQAVPIDTRDVLLGLLIGDDKMALLRSIECFKEPTTSTVRAPKAKDPYRLNIGRLGESNDFRGGAIARGRKLEVRGRN